MLCIYRSTDRPIAYRYKMKLQSSLGLAVLYFILGLPLFVLITNAMFDSRQKNVYQVTFLAESIDLQTSKSSLPVMQFDDSLEALSTKGLCSRETSVTKDGESSSNGEGNSISDAKSPNNEAVKYIKEYSPYSFGVILSVSIGIKRNGRAACPIDPIA